MLKNKVIETIKEMLGDELLSEKDFGGVSRVTFGEIPLTTYTLEVYNDIDSRGDCYVRVDEPISTVEKVNNLSRVYIPILRGCFVKELAIKWYHPQLYINRAEYYCVREDGSTRCIPQHRFKKTVMMYIRAAELYEKLVAELLPLFKEEDRETAKFKLLADTVSMCAQQISNEVGNGIFNDIKCEKNAIGVTNVSQEKIDTWIKYSNIADAWVTLGNNYTRSEAIYSYNTYLEALKAGLRKNELYPPKHPDSSLRGWYIPSPSCHVKKFLEERQIALNQLNQYEIVSVKIHPLTMMFTRSNTKKSSLIDSICISDVTAQDGERVELLDQLEGYISKYKAPKMLAANAIDTEIMLCEKNVMNAVKNNNQSDIKELLQITNDSTKLLSLVSMRYKASLDTKEEPPAYFSFFTPASVKDKSYYCEIFVFYLDNVFKKCLVPLLKLTSKNSSIYEGELKFAIEAKNILVELSQAIVGIDSQLADRAVKGLDDIQNLCGPENIISDRTIANTGLRQRHLAKV